MRLSARWSQAWNDLGISAPDAVLVDLCARYSELHRAYHTLRHLEECFAAFDGVRSQCDHPGEVELAIWFHDAVYDTRASDNEATSARLASSVLASGGVPPAARERVHDLVLVTRHDEPPATGDGRLLADVDLSILGSSPARFDEYETQVRFEYSWVAEDAFRETRRRMLAKLLDRPTVYYTSHFQDLLERRARENLERSLARLGAGGH